MTRTYDCEAERSTTFATVRIDVDGFSKPEGIGTFYDTGSFSGQGIVML